MPDFSSHFDNSNHNNSLHWRHCSRQDASAFADNEQSIGIYHGLFLCWAKAICDNIEMIHWTWWYSCWRRNQHQERNDLWWTGWRNCFRCYCHDCFVGAFWNYPKAINDRNCFDIVHSLNTPKSSSQPLLRLLLSSLELLRMWLSHHLNYHHSHNLYEYRYTNQMAAIWTALWADAATWNFDDLTFFFTVTSLHFAKIIKNNERFIEKFYQLRPGRQSFKCATHTRARALHQSNSRNELKIECTAFGFSYWSKWKLAKYISCWRLFCGERDIRIYSYTICSHTNDNVIKLYSKDKK